MARRIPMIKAIQATLFAILLVLAAAMPARAQDVDPEQIKAQVAEWTRLVDRFGREVSTLRLDEAEVARLTDRANAVKGEAAALKDTATAQVAETRELLELDGRAGAGRNRIRRGRGAAQGSSGAAGARRRLAAPGGAGHRPRRPADRPSRRQAHRAVRAHGPQARAIAAGAADMARWRPRARRARSAVRYLVRHLVRPAVRRQRCRAGDAGRARRPRPRAWRRPDDPRVPDAPLPARARTPHRRRGSS